MDLNGPKAPNILGRDLRYFTIDPKYKSAIDRTADDVIAEDSYLVTPKKPECSSCDCDPKFCPPTSACEANPNGLECCQTRASSIASPYDPCCNYSVIKAVQSVCTIPTPPCTSCSCNPALCTTPTNPETPPGGGGQDPCQVNPTSLECCRTRSKDITSIKDACCAYEEIQESNKYCRLPKNHSTCHIKKLVLDGNKYYAEFSGHGDVSSVQFNFWSDDSWYWQTKKNCISPLSGTIDHEPAKDVMVVVYPYCDYGYNSKYPAAGENFCFNIRPPEYPPQIHIPFPFTHQEIIYPHKDPSY